MKRAIVAGMSLCSALWAISGRAYEPWTHYQLSSVALPQTVLVLPPLNASAQYAPTTLLQDLALRSYDDLNQLFPDIQWNEEVEFGPSDEGVPSGISSTNTAHTIILNKVFTPGQQQDDIQNLVLDGSMLEDAGSRAINHFYNPVTGFGLSVGGVGTLAWAQFSHCEGASGGSGAYEPTDDNPELSINPTDQCYSLKDAQSYYYYSLTAPDPAVRKQQFGDLFLTMGHLMHLAEDMAQPQHVRNDEHCDAIACKLVGKYHPSEYEAYVYGVTRDGSLGGFANYPTTDRPVVDPPRNIPTWNASNYLTSDYIGQSTSGLGIADFTSSNFVSAGTNFQTPVGNLLPQPIANFPSPTPSGSYSQPLYDVYAEIGVPLDKIPADVKSYCDALAAQTPSVICNVTFYTTAVSDNYDNAASNCNLIVRVASHSDTGCQNSHASTDSIFTSDLKKVNLNSGVAVQAVNLNQDNYQSQMDYLLPRAIGYSAGLVDYFFRGKIHVDWDDTDPGGPSAQSSFILTNLSTSDMNGNLEIWYDGVDGQRHQANPQGTPVNIGAYCAPVLNGQANPNCSWLASDHMDVTVPFPLNPPAARPNDYMFVYKGTIGDVDTDNYIAAYYYRPSTEYELQVDNFIDPQTGGLWDAAVRYDVDGNLLIAGEAPAFTQSGAQHGCKNPEPYQLYFCSQQAGLAFYRADVNMPGDAGTNIDREYIVRDTWGIHAADTRENVEQYPNQNNVTLLNQFDFAKYTRDVDSQGNFLPFSHPEYQDCFGALSGVAVNTANVFALVQRTGTTLSPTTNQATGIPCPYVNQSGAGAYLDIFDHTGKLQGMAFIPEIGYGNPLFPQISHGSGVATGWIVANDKMLCLTGTTVAEVGSPPTPVLTGFAELRNLDGSGSPIRLESGTAIGCAATADRFYVVDGTPFAGQPFPTTSTVAVLNSYDSNGILKGSVNLTEILKDGQNPIQVAVSSNTVYVMTAGAPTRVYRYWTKLGASGDSFGFIPVRQPTAAVPNPPANPIIATGTQQGPSISIVVDSHQALLAPPQD
jgi:hypothetical protein